MSAADSGAGTLRQAILSANISSGTDSIRFAMPGGGIVTIVPRTELPPLTGPVVFDGTTQPGFAGIPLVALIGTNLTAAGSGLRVQGGGSTVRGMRISGFAVAGIRLDGAGANVVVGNILGHAGAPGAPESNGIGLLVGTNCSNNTIGGTDTSDRNIVSGNREAGLLLSAGASGNVIQGNWVGLSNVGESANGNGGAGILLSNALRTTIGGPEAQAGNLISGNLLDGIRIAGNDAQGDVIQGNVIGLNALGGVASNQRHGIYLEGKKVTVGGVEPGAGNVISGNRGAGIWVLGEEHVVQGNLIGTAPDGVHAAPNGAGPERYAGMVAFGSGHTLGGSALGRNVISGNAGTGLLLLGAGVDVKGNYIGTGADGASPVPNLGDGIRLEGGAAMNQLGGELDGEENVIAHNLGAGVSVSGADTVFNRIMRNRFSGNGGLGIDLERPGEDPARTLNDPLDDDAGPNGLQNFPLITNVTTMGGLTAVEGALFSRPDRSFSLELYQSATAHPSGYGEGAEYLGAIGVDTDSAGAGSFLFLLEGEFNGRFFTVTATDAESGDTSEFSPAFLNSSALPVLQVNDVLAAEPTEAGLAQFRVELSTPTAKAVGVRYATASGTALEGLDYSGTNGFLLFEPGEKERVISVVLFGDSISELDEQFFINLSQPLNASLGRSHASATIFELVITGIQRTSQAVDVRFTSSTNRLYHLERAERLQPGWETIWRGVPGAMDLPGTGAPVTARDTNHSGAAAWYRVVGKEANR